MPERRRKRRKRGERNTKIIELYIDFKDPTTVMMKHKGGRPIVIKFDKKITLEEAELIPELFSDGYSKSEFKEDHPELSSHCVSWRLGAKSDWDDEVQ